MDAILRRQIPDLDRLVTSPGGGRVARLSGQLTAKAIKLGPNFDLCNMLTDIAGDDDSAYTPRVSDRQTAERSAETVARITHPSRMHSRMNDAKLAACA